MWEEKCMINGEEREGEEAGGDERKSDIEGEGYYDVLGSEGRRQRG